MSNQYKVTTNYGLISGIYFRKILKVIIQLGGLGTRNIIILDFGAGFGFLKSMLLKLNSFARIVNYDIKKDLTEIEDWRDVEFDVLVCNEVFYTFEKEELIHLLNELKSHNKNLEMLVGISKQGFLNNLGKILLGEFDAHSGTKLKPIEEINVLQEHMDVIAKRTIWGLADVYHLKFKKIN